MARKTARKKELKTFDKYDYYTRSVQSPAADSDFISECYQELRGKQARVLREDFCGTFINSCAWVKRHNDNKAYGVDLDPEPIAYGRQHYLAKLLPHEQGRVEVHCRDVLKKGLPQADAVIAMNFSFFVFKRRRALLQYFKNCQRSLTKDGILIVDCFGGSQCYQALEEETPHRDFSYFWDLDSYDPITNEVKYYIHFKRKGEKKRERCFTYDWRMWSIPEIREVMADAGFSKSHVYWEGVDSKGGGDGQFKNSTVGEECEAWVAYVVGEK